MILKPIKYVTITQYIDELQYSISMDTIKWGSPQIVPKVKKVFKEPTGRKFKDFD